MKYKIGELYKDNKQFLKGGKKGKKFEKQKNFDLTDKKVRFKPNLLASEGDNKENKKKVQIAEKTEKIEKVEND